MESKDCPFCRKNGLLKGEPVAELPEAYLVENYFSPGNYLIVPTDHIESPTDLPDNWWQSVKQLIQSIPPPLADYNLSFNAGKNAGQTIQHVHLWVIPRKSDEPASGKGLLTLIAEANR